MELRRQWPDISEAADEETVRLIMCLVEVMIQI